ncbi:MULTISPECIES: hypothetical protein [Sphingomonadaceae]|jgi:hypothetical protein|uniref:hypothetical protein n=1 Tax=Sphingomonadales TaxID=204457 RepID=UPI000DC62414|nr:MULTISPECIES: hypothetical protein [Sphingomonadaceae]BBB12905.1 putative ABC transporter ATP-binding protein [Sphingopyxis sp. FD7]HQV04648.1 hypothetical protein [Novosphingobium sp.]
MKVRIDDVELARAIGVGLAVTGKRGQSKDHAVSILRQLAPYALFREAGSAELMSSSVPLFPDDFGIVRAELAYAESETQRREQRRHFDWPVRLIVK